MEHQIATIEDIETTHMAELEQEIAQVDHAKRYAELEAIIQQHADTGPNIYSRMLTAQSMVSGLKKDVDAGKFMGVSGGQVFAKASIALSDAGICFVVDIPEAPVKDNNRTTCKIVVAFVNADDPREKIVMQSYGEAMGNDAFSVQKAVTSATKIALLRSLLMSDKDDEISSEAQNIQHVPVKQIEEDPSQIWAKELKQAIEICPNEPTLKKLIEDSSDEMQKQTDARRAFFDKIVTKRMSEINVAEQLKVHNLAVHAMEELPE